MLSVEHEETAKHVAKPITEQGNSRIQDNLWNIIFMLYFFCCLYSVYELRLVSTSVGIFVIGMREGKQIGRYLFLLISTLRIIGFIHTLAIEEELTLGYELLAVFFEDFVLQFVGICHLQR